ncbi:hypothetical protein H7F51_00405 [Novosphingobium flavum]|uniref:Uncharacterized protein n=1 Tax=Novosphingobium flavum TaxID=1778672 RepID=A0A7X1FNB0_9SPHN|nr:hypothetical protein [Novosphingobium flavum]MBC2663970.1 hypothetical protein [Novosphingobium flavum]
MATRPNQSGRSAGPQLVVAPTQRELRSQAIHRLQMGLFGLAAMLLLVGLANIIMERARMAESTFPQAAGLPTEAAAPKSDPLADMGVIPSPEAKATAAPVPAPTN